MKLKHLSAEPPAELERASRTRTKHLDRFRKSYVVAESGCWIWTKQKYPKTGHARFNAGYHSMLAHEMSYTLATGLRVENETIEQTCGRRDCVNPAHLRPSGRKKFYDCGRRVTPVSTNNKGV